MLQLRSVAVAQARSCALELLGIVSLTYDLAPLSRKARDLRRGAAHELEPILGCGLPIRGDRHEAPERRGFVSRTLEGEPAVLVPTAQVRAR